MDHLGRLSFLTLVLLSYALPLYAPGLPSRRCPEVS